jgi:hypothetical protein
MIQTPWTYLLNRASLYQICHGRAASLTDPPLFPQDAGEKIVHDSIEVFVDSCGGVFHQRVPDVIHRTLHIGVGIKPVCVLAIIFM